MTYTGTTATTFTGITRAADNTTAITTATAAINDASNITATATTITYDTLASGTTFPNQGTIKIGSEQISYTGKTTTTLTGLTRGVNGTTAATHNNNAVITLLPEVSLVESIETLGLETRTTLIDDASNITATATSITVDSTVGFEDNGYLRIENELIHYTGTTATTGTTSTTTGTTTTTSSTN